ncbi:hypothetical protein [Mammaliicoccus sciuri]|uniref:hypothetical protein n=1 Tax=Mammaliicoccus sciuri TaxID=1296 RepID=UPI003F5692F7
MVLSKNSEKVLKALESKRKEYQRKKGVKDRYIVIVDINYIKKILPNESPVSLRGLLNYLLKEKFIYNNIANNESFITLSDFEENNVQIFIGEKGIAYLNHKKYILLSKIIPICISVLSLIVSIFNMLNH